MLEALDAHAVQRWCSLATTRLRQHEQELNDLNVYPVPDGDTGTNMLLTMLAAEKAVTQATAHHNGDAGVTDTLRTMARGALMGARGNSGVITAQWLAGLAAGIEGPAPLRQAASAAYEAVAHPVEGTILTVARAADGATIEEAADAAAVALAHTPEQLPVLAQAGVVDAGGRGLVVLLDALVETLTGTAQSHEIEAFIPVETVAQEYRGPAFEVQFLIDTSAGAVAQLRAALDRLGDSLVVVGGQPAWRVHVHVDDVGAAIEAALEAGRPYQIQVTHLTSARAEHGPRRPDPTARATIVTAAGDGIAELFAA